ncbi:MAG: ABC transporter substrate-binding protein [Gammaproteobacteria bacterium]|nr:ABC transporter substrate-binding protein [Gammaproteobacteria bacterium]
MNIKRRNGVCLLLGAVMLQGLSFNVSAANNEKIKVGVMLPFSGVYAHLGKTTRDGMLLAIEQHADMLNGREIEFVESDTKAQPALAPELASEMLNRHKADFVVGPVHSGVLLGMLRVLRNQDTVMIIPNAGAQVATGQLCAPNVFRTSFSTWQTTYPMGQVAIDRGYKNIYTISWNYTGGKEAIAGFEESFKAAGGTISKQILVPFPSTNFQPIISDVASAKPDAVFVFFAGGGAIEFVNTYSAMGLSDTIPLLGAGFLTEGTLEQQGDAAEGILTTLHYSNSLENAENEAFRAAFQKKYDYEPDLYSVQGYDTGLLIVEAVASVGGDVSDKKKMLKAMSELRIQSPRGDFTFSKANNPVQDIYLREVVEGKNLVKGIASKSLEDPARGCDL